MKPTRELFITLLDQMENGNQSKLKEACEEFIEALIENETQADNWCKLQVSLEKAMMPKLWDSGRVM